MPPKGSNSAAGKCFVTREDLSTFGDELGRKMAYNVQEVLQKLDSKFVKLDSEFESKFKKLDSKLTQTIKQVEMCNRYAHIMKHLHNHKETCGMQVSALGSTLGVQVEQAARNKLRQFSKGGVPPYMLFSSPINRMSIEFKNLEDVCRYLEIISKEEWSYVLEGVCSKVSVSNIEAFVLMIFQELKVPADNISNIRCLFLKCTASMISRALKMLKIKGFAKQHIIQCLWYFFDLLGDVTWKEVEVVGKVFDLCRMEKLDLKSPFLFMYLTWLASGGVGNAGQKAGSIRSMLEIDARGMCLRKRMHFHVSFAEIKSSDGDLPQAKLQLNLVEGLLNTVVNFLNGSTVDIDKVVLLYKKEVEREFKQLENGFYVSYIAD